MYAQDLKGEIMLIHPEEILETIQMVTTENLDIRTVTMGINLRDCCHPDIDEFNSNIYEKITTYAKDLVPVTDEISRLYGVPIVNKRISVTPIAIVAEACKCDDYVPIAKTLDKAASKVGVNFIGGFSSLVHKGMTHGDMRLISSIPQALATTEKVCSSVNVATTNAGINMDAVALMGDVIKQTAALTADRNGIGCAKLVVFANAPEDNPFMAGAFHGVGEADRSINVGVSGPGVVNAAVRALKDPTLNEISETIKKTAFKITRMGEKVGREVSSRLNAQFGVLDLSLAPTLQSVTVWLRYSKQWVLRDAVPRHHCRPCHAERCCEERRFYGLLLRRRLKGAFIPVSEDAGMIRVVQDGSRAWKSLRP